MRMRAGIVRAIVEANHGPGRGGPKCGLRNGYRGHLAEASLMKVSVRIAVADDEPRMRQFYEEVLPVLGHEVVYSAATGKELLAGCQQVHPDLVITDIKMPDMDG